MHYRIEEFNVNSHYYNGKTLNDIMNYINKTDYNRQPKKREDLLNIQNNLSNSKFWIALNDENKVIGFIGLDFLDGLNSYAKRFYILKEYRGIGLSYSLMNEVIKFAYLKKIKNIYFGCLSGRDRALKFYNNYGFIEIKEEQMPMKHSQDDYFFVGCIHDLYNKHIMNNEKFL